MAEVLDGGERFYRTLVETSTDLIWAVDLEGRFTYINPAAALVLGFGPDELLGAPFTDIQPPDVADADARAFARMLDGQVVYGMDTVRLRKDGSRVALSVNAMPLRDETGRIVGITGTARDVTERRRAERIQGAFSDLGRRLSAARTPEEAARIIVQVAQELLGWDCCSLDLFRPQSGTMQAVLTMDSFGGPPVDVPHAYEEGPPTGMALTVLQDGARLILRDGTPQPEPTVLVPFGTNRPSASLMFVPIRHRDRVAGILSIQSYTRYAYTSADLDILQALADHCGGALERLRVEEALRESQAQVARAEAFSLVMTAHLGLDGRWLKVPANLGPLLGYGEAELQALRLEDVTHPEDHEADLRQRARLIRGEVRSYEAERRFLRRDGRVAWIYLNCSIVQDDGGHPLYLLVYLRDLTERKNLEDQLRQAQKMEAVGQLAGGIAHDFNNLLTAIQGNAELLLTALDGHDPRRMDVHEIGRAAHRAATLTRQLLAFSRKQVLQPRIVNLNLVVTDLTAMLRRIIGEDVELQLDLDPRLGPVLADAGQVEQVITNLSVNARDAMPLGGTLTLRTRNVSADEVPAGDPEAPPLLGELVALSVADTGTGMDERTRARLFEPFFTTKELGRGTGLGLATVYGIVRQSGGHIRVGTRLGEGSTFTVYLPRAEGEAELEPLSEAVGVPAPGTETVLIVEDEDAVRLLARRVLTGRGYRVLDAPGAAEALALIDQGRRHIDLLVTDIVMPGMGGPALAERLAALQPGLRVLYITGYAEEAIQRQGALPAGGALLEKPFTADQLARRVRESISGGDA
jgi:PAS domain S-box-containing protein